MSEKKGVSWQWIAGIAVTAVGTLVLLAFADTREQLKGKADLTSVSALSDSVNTRIKAIEDRSKSMDDKLDFIILMHIDENGDIKRMK